MSELDGAFDRFIEAIPKTETHLHVEGGLPYALLVELDPSRFRPDPFFRKVDYKYPSFVDFENLLIEHAVQWFSSAERYHLACERMFQEMWERNVRYVETSFHLHMIEFAGVNGPEVLSAIKSAAPEGMQVRVIGGMVRNGYTERMKPVIDSLHEWEDLDGIDMHGQEWLELEEWAPPVWRRCREAGKIVKVHAGELCGPESIYQALDRLGSRRIQHGVRAREDQALLERLARDGVVLDVCPLSNEKLRVFDSLESHSLRELMAAGIDCTISTDDPLCFFNTIDDEYRALHERLELGLDELATLAKNGFKHARMNETLKAGYIAEIEAALASR